MSSNIVNDQLVTVLRDCSLLNNLVIPVTGFSASTKAAKIKYRFT
jgi:hypothetical protein